MTSEQLAQRFADLAAQQEAAILVNENARYNALVDRVADVEKELRRRNGDETSSLRSL